jgi:hypothetical protein
MNIKGYVKHKYFQPITISHAKNSSNKKMLEIITDNIRQYCHATSKIVNHLSQCISNKVVSWVLSHLALFNVFTVLLCTKYTCFFGQFQSNKICSFDSQDPRPTLTMIESTQYLYWKKNPTNTKKVECLHKFIKYYTNYTAFYKKYQII